MSRVLDTGSALSRRERQIMDIVFARGEATVNEVLAVMDNPPTRSAVRTMLRILEEKGHLQHRKMGREFVYRPTEERKRAGLSAMQRVIETFYDGSLEEALAAHLLEGTQKVDTDELQRLSELINSAREKGN